MNFNIADKMMQLLANFIVLYFVGNRLKPHGFFSAYTITLAYSMGMQSFTMLLMLRLEIRSIFQWVIQLHTLK